MRACLISLLTVGLSILVGCNRAALPKTEPATPRGHAAVVQERVEVPATKPPSPQTVSETKSALPPPPAADLGQNETRKPKTDREALREAMDDYGLVVSNIFKEFEPRHDTENAASGKAIEVPVAPALVGAPGVR